MNEDLRDRLSAFAGDAGPADPADLRRAARRRRRRLRIGAGGAAAVVVAVAVGAVALSGGGDPEPVDVNAGPTASTTAEPGLAVAGLRPGDWLDLPADPPDRVAGGAAVVDGSVVVYGGRGRDQAQEPVIDSLVVGLSDGAVRSLDAPFGSGENTLVAATEGGVLVCCGESGDEAAMLDPVGDTWRSVAAPPDVGVVDHEAQVVDGVVAFVGQIAPTPMGVRPDVLVTYDIAADRWATTPLPEDMSSGGTYIELVAVEGSLLLHERSPSGGRLWIGGLDGMWREAGTTLANAALAVDANTVYAWGEDLATARMALWEATFPAMRWSPLEVAALEGTPRSSEGALGRSQAAVGNGVLAVWVDGVLGEMGQRGLVMVDLATLTTRRVSPPTDDPPHRPFVDVVDGLVVLVAEAVHVTPVDG